MPSCLTSIYNSYSEKARYYISEFTQTTSWISLTLIYIISPEQSLKTKKLKMYIFKSCRIMCLAQWETEQSQSIHRMFSPVHQ